jgi:hypothetical protein
VGGAARGRADATPPARASGGLAREGAHRSSCGGNRWAVAMSVSISALSSASTIWRRSPSTPLRSPSKASIQPRRRRACSLTFSPAASTSASSITRRKSSASSSKIVESSASLSASSCLKPRAACPVRASSSTSIVDSRRWYLWERGVGWWRFARKCSRVRDSASYASIAVSCFDFRLSASSFTPWWSVDETASASFAYAGSVCTSPTAAS